MFQYKGQVLNYNENYCWQLRNPACNGALPAIQHPSYVLAIVSTHTDKPNSLVRGPFQVSLFSMSVTDHLLSQSRDNHPELVVFLFGGEVG